MNKNNDFTLAFESLTGNPPFPWQTKLYESWFSQGKIPSVCDIPTGLGKTSVIAIWLIARAKGAELPRRLVYVVNRRTVVDQTTNEVEKLRERLLEPEEQGIPPQQVESLKFLAASLSKLSGTKSDVPLAISTLRGQFADNSEWSSDPTRPAVICGTVDMIGSRLLFSGYRIGFKSRPLHAGFLGQDALLVHDEAHLEPAFQNLIEAIKLEQHDHEITGNLPWSKLEVMALSATVRNAKKETEKTKFELGAEDDKHVIVQRRIRAKKKLLLHPCEDEKKFLVDQIVKLALDHKESGDAILVFLRGVANALKVKTSLEEVAPGQVVPLTGTMRGHERDRLVREDPVFARFMPVSDRPNDAEPKSGTVYLVCTSAGEVGVNLSADHMVGDLSTFDSMAQRFGRVNRFGDRDDTRIDVVYPESFDDKKPNPEREKTLTLLQRLNGDVSPKALGGISSEDRSEAFAPLPDILPATDILFDAWALTSIREKMPGRPPVEPYLHGVAEWEPARTSVAWREEVERISDELLDRYGKDFPQLLLEDYPLKPHELLSDRTDRIYQQLEALASEPKSNAKKKRESYANTNVWLIEDRDSVRVKALKDLLGRDKKRAIAQLENCTVLLPPSMGGLSDGLFDAASDKANDVADLWLDEQETPRRKRLLSKLPQVEAPPDNMALIRLIDTNPLADEYAAPVEESELLEDTEVDEDTTASSIGDRFWHWFSRPRETENASRASLEPIRWEHHTQDVVNETAKRVKTLTLPDQLKAAIDIAAALHDLGKQREMWQRGIGNPNPSEWYAKPGKPKDGLRWRPRQLSKYRHEFGSLLDILYFDSPHWDELRQLSDEMQDVVLHLIATHHGRGRPHFTDEETIDPSPVHDRPDDVALDAMRRYARLQRQYGRWGLAYLESLLRAADWAASAEPSPIGGAE